jgi:VWFA-related protein
MRILFGTLICGVLLAQQQAPPPQPKTPQQQQAAADQSALKFNTIVRNIVAEATVFDSDGNFVSGIRPDQFRLFDNGKEQNIHVDEAFIPISMVIAIQCNAEVDKILPQVNRIGNLISPLLLGQQGEAAVLAFDSRLRTLQDFTSEPDKITAAVKKIQSGSMSAHLVDAVDQAVLMLKTRDKNRRRIILLISESRDQGSSGRGRETLINLQVNNVTLYAVPMSRLVSKLTAPPDDPRPTNNPPAMYSMPMGVASTPTTVMQTYGTDGNSAQFMPLLIEIYKDAKAIFKSNPMEVFTRGTGGQEFSFYGGHGLEQAIQRIGEQLHSEYTISYAPNNPEEGGFHKIAIDVTGHPNVRRVLSRPGYWIATSQ